MRQIKLLDTTLRDGEQSPGCSMHINEKLEIAETLEKLNIDIIEAGFPVISDGDFKAVYEISKLLKTTTAAALARCRKIDVDAARDALAPAAFPRLHLFIATSPIHLEYKLKMTEEQVLEAISESINYAKRFFKEIQFSFEDACRTPLPFLIKATKTAVDAGAKIINLPDTVGYITPDEIYNIFSSVKASLGENSDVVLSTHNHDDLGLAVANSIAAVRAGADQIEGTVTGIGERAGNTALEEIIMGFKTRKAFYGCDTAANTKMIYRTCKLVTGIIGRKIPPNKAVVGENAFAHEAGIHQHGVLEAPSTYEIMTPESIGITNNKLLLGKHSGRHAFAAEIKKMGYELDDATLDYTFKKFKDLADKKKTVSKLDIEAIMPKLSRTISNRMYALDNYEASSFKGGASVQVSLISNDEVISETASGDGPVDAAFKAINNITGYDFALEDFAIHSVTEGKDALGESVIKLRLGDKLFTGRGVSTDVLESAILAYVNAVNKHMEEVTDEQ